jgi:hypothetical protein
MVEWIPQLPTVAIPRMPTQYGRAPVVTHAPLTPTPTPTGTVMADVVTQGVTDLIVVGIFGMILLVALFLWMRNRAQGGW